MENIEKQKKKRPGWVWVISIFFFLSVGWTLLSFYLINAGVVQPNPAERAYFEGLTSVDYGLSILMGLANLTGAVALFFLRKVALYLFVTALVANFLLTAWHMATKDWVEAISGAGLLGALIGWGLLIAVCIYSWKLTKTGVLT